MKIGNESGRSLVEMLGVMAIIGVLTLGAISSISFGLDTMRVELAFDNVETTAQSVHDLYSWGRSYPKSGDPKENMRTKLCTNGVFSTCPDECDGDACTTTAWGKIIVSASSGDTNIGGETYPEGTYFKITLTGVPKAACSRLLGYAWTNVSPLTINCGDDPKLDMVFIGY